MQTARAVMLAVAIATSAVAASAQAPATTDTFSTNTAPSSGQPPLQGSVTATDPMVCFDHAWRDTRAAIQAYQVVNGSGWQKDTECRDRGSAPSGLGSCWGTLSQARGLVEQAAQLFETGRKSSAPESEQLINQANALVKQAASLADSAGKCFQPLNAQAQRNRAKGGQLQGGVAQSARPAPPKASTPGSGGTSPGTPGTGPSSPNLSGGVASNAPPASAKRPPASPSSVADAARAVGEAIAGGDTGPHVLDPLEVAVRALPPEVARPIDCWDMMVDALSKRKIRPDFAIARARQAEQCYQASAAGGPGLLLKGHVVQNVGKPPPGDRASCPTPPDPSVQQHLMDLAGGLDHMVDQATDYSLAATERFFDVAAQAVSARLKGLAQAAADPPAAAQQAMDAIVTYMTSDHNENDARLYDGAVAAVDQIQKDPAGFLAQFTVDTAANAATGAVAGKVVACARGATQSAASAAKRAQAIADAEKTAQKLKQMEDGAGKFAKLAEDSGTKSGRGRSPSGGGFGNGPGSGTGPNGAPGTPPPAMQTLSPEMSFCEGLPNQCFNVALAQAETWEKGAPHFAMPNAPATALQFSPAGEATVWDALKRKYGGRAISGIPSWRQKLQNLGRPSTMSGRKAIMDELNAAGDGAQGLIFVRQNPGDIGHVFNAARIDGEIVFKDMTGRMEALHGTSGVSIVNMDPSFMLEANPSEIYWYRVH
ncbi:MAG: toxin glutamine deamidase domain-containing protein [Stellaceae bacterium]